MVKKLTLTEAKTQIRKAKFYGDAIRGAFESFNNKYCKHGKCPKQGHGARSEGNKRGCCVDCGREHGYLIGWGTTSPAGRQRAKLEKRYGFNKKTGYFDGRRGCKLPYWRRSWTCLTYCCDYEDMHGVYLPAEIRYMWAKELAVLLGDAHTALGIHTSDTQGRSSKRVKCLTEGGN